ncbi:hypothetical protein QR680_018884 [Steinernema hermaphroditum]|uniref:Prolyl endopeptidase n=1 Tax=Steinernema hermaphroditum TaxID=289476 RepID=A0AA39LRQ4_9BILA|nr:hypothetical protein QR680_018884 [Steinernema hermaphroditum]
MRRLCCVLLLFGASLGHIHPDDYPQLYRSGWTEKYFDTTVTNSYHRMDKAISPTLDDYLATLNRKAKEYLRNEKEVKERKVVDDRIFEIYQNASPDVKCPVLGPNGSWFTQVVTMADKFLYRHKNVSNYDDTKFMHLDRHDFLEDVSLSFSPDNTHFLAIFALRSEQFALFLFKYNDSTEFLSLGTAIYQDAVYGIPGRDVTWHPDSSGFFHQQHYSSSFYHKPMKNVVFRRISSPEDFVPVYQFPERDQAHAYAVYYKTKAIHGDRLVLTTIFNATEVKYFQADLSGGRVPTHVDFHPINASIGDIADALDGESVYLISVDEAPNRELKRYFFANNSFATVIPERNDLILETFHVVSGGQKLLVRYRNINSVTLMIFDLRSGRLIDTSWSVDYGTVALCPISPHQSDILLIMTTFDTPNSVYRIFLDSPNERPQLVYGRDVYRASVYKHKLVYFTSPDGTQVPMTVIRRTERHDRNQLVLLHGYGGFGIALTVSYRPLTHYLVDYMDAAVAYVHVRGGSDLGNNWHTAARRLKKQNSFDDFTAAAEYLIAENYTVPSRIVAMGASNGGLLVAASAFQRPDLFGVVIPKFGVMDMLRYFRYPNKDGGPGAYWMSEFGLPDTHEEFKNLVAYSPLEQAKRFNFSHQFPATFFVTGQFDQRVYRAHTAKVVAEFYHRAREVGREVQRKPVIAQSYYCGHKCILPRREMVTMLTDQAFFITKTMSWSGSLQQNGSSIASLELIFALICIFITAH